MAMNFLEARQVNNRIAAGFVWALARRLNYASDPEQATGYDEAQYAFFDPATQQIDVTKVTEFEAARTFINDRFADHTEPTPESGLAANPFRVIYDEMWRRWYRVAQAQGPDLGA